MTKELNLNEEFHSSDYLELRLLMKIFTTLVDLIGEMFPRTQVLEDMSTYAHTQTSPLLTTNESYDLFIPRPGAMTDQIFIVGVDFLTQARVDESSRPVRSGNVLFDENYLPLSEFVTQLQEVKFKQFCYPDYQQGPNQVIQQVCKFLSTLSDNFKAAFVHDLDADEPAPWVRVRIVLNSEKPWDGLPVEVMNKFEILLYIHGNEPPIYPTLT